MGWSNGAGKNMAQVMHCTTNNTVLLSHVFYYTKQTPTSTTHILTVKQNVGALQFLTYKPVCLTPVPVPSLHQSA